jgi:hypothetical protein
MFKGPDGSTSGCYQSYGILQIKVHDFNTWDFARNSTSFNVDFRSAEQRACMNGDFADYFKSGHGLVTGGYPTMRKRSRVNWPPVRRIKPTRYFGAAWVCGSPAVGTTRMD